MAGAGGLSVVGKRRGGGSLWGGFSRDLFEQLRE